MPIFEFFFNKTVGLDSRPATLLKRSFQQGGISCSYIKILSAFPRRSNVKSTFDKIAGSELQARNFIQMLVHHKLLSQNSLFKAARFWKIFSIESVVKTDFGRFVFSRFCRFVDCRLANSLK